MPPDERSRQLLAVAAAAGDARWAARLSRRPGAGRRPADAAAMLDDYERPRAAGPRWWWWLPVLLAGLGLLLLLRREGKRPW